MTLSEIHFDTFGEDHDNGRIVRVLDIVPWQGLFLKFAPNANRYGISHRPFGIEIPPMF